MDDIRPFFNTVIEDGITYYVIPANTPLFRGDIPVDNKNPLSHMNGPVFFGESVDVALIYGLPFEYKTINEVKLLALDKSMQTIYANAVNPVIQSILKKNYGYPNGNRNSEDHADKQLTEYICNTYGGYALDYMPTEGGGKFHREIVLCNKNLVEFVRKVPISQAEEQTIIDNQKMRRTELDRLETKKRQRTERESNNDNTSYLRRGALFGDDFDEQDNVNVWNRGASLFGEDEDNDKNKNESSSSGVKKLFDDDEMDDEIPGGKRPHKKKIMRRTKKNSKKRSCRRKTNKRVNCRNNSKRRIEKSNNKTRLK